MGRHRLRPALQFGTRRGGARIVSWYRQDTLLANSLVGVWRLDEVSGNGVDSIGSSTLTDNATVTSNTGIIYPLAREFVIANSESLSAADSATLSGANIDMWGAVWCRPTAVNVTSTVFGKWNTSGNREWQIAQVNADVILQTSPDGTATGNGLVTAAGVLVANEWTLAVWYHDATNNLIGLSINGGAFTTAAYSTGIFNSAASFRIGGQGAGTAFFGGRIQQAVLGKNYIPTEQNASFLFNYGLNNGVYSFQFIGYGGEVDWSPGGEQLVFDRRDDDGAYQLFTMNPDGSGEVCISVPVVAGGPDITRHKGWPYYHPTDPFLVCQVEIVDQENTGGGTPEQVAARHSTAEPGAGWWNDVWVCRTDGSEWWKLTNYSAAGNTGVLSPRFSPDGTKLLWASRTGAASGGDPFGVWNLQLADFSLPSGVPTLGSITTLTPGTKSFYEAHGFSRDSTKILYTSDPDTGNEYGFDIFIYTISGGATVNLTASDAEWDEHAHYAPHADVIAFMSSKPYPAYTATAIAGLKSELFVMNADGTNKRKISHFNAANFTESDIVDPSVSTVCAWHPSGTRLVVCQLHVGASFDTVAGRKLWMVNFNGVYE